MAMMPMIGLRLRARIGWWDRGGREFLSVVPQISALTGEIHGALACRYPPDLDLGRIGSAGPGGGKGGWWTPVD